MWIKETIMGMYLKRYNGGYQQRGDMIVSENAGDQQYWSSNMGPTSSGWWYTYPSEKYDFVSWDDDIPNWMDSHKIHVPNHQPVINNSRMFSNQQQRVACCLHSQKTSSPTCRSAPFIWDHPMGHHVESRIHRIHRLVVGGAKASMKKPIGSRTSADLWIIFSCLARFQHP